MKNSLEWLVRFCIVFGALCITRHYADFQLAVLSGIAWIIADEVL